ncbi:MAG: ATP synthase F0 subunit B [Deltaproteobacteria bacterium]|nr:ATP synthase F0 subunit B [Deltaproteobacteria bacterium]
MEIIKTTALITINETLWVQMIGFLIFLFLIDRIMFRRVRRNIADREAHFDTLRQDILDLKEEMGGLLRQTEEEEQQLRAAARKIDEDLRQEGRREADTLISRALEEIHVLQQDAEQRLKASLATARQQIESSARELTASIIHHLMNGRPRP